MMTMKRFPIVIAAMLALPPSAGAVQYKELGQSMEKVSPVLSTLERAVAVQLQTISAYQHEGPGFKSPTKRDLKSRLTTGTFAVGRYTYADTDTGVLREHRFYARSGPDIYPDAPDFNTHDEADFRKQGGRSLARAQFREFSSSIDASTPGAAHDAEFKIARSLEYKMTAQGMPSGGNLKIWVSQQPCTSCRGALDQLERLRKPGIAPPKVKAVHVGQDPVKGHGTFANFHEKRKDQLRALFDDMAAVRARVGKPGGPFTAGCP